MADPRPTAAMLMAHGVEAGKTAAMIIAAQEIPPHRPDRWHRRVRRARQHGRTVRFRDYLRLYPAARVPTPSRATQIGAIRRVRGPARDRRLRHRDLLHNQLRRSAFT